MATHPALTTTFTPPSSCLHALMRATPSGGLDLTDQLGPSSSATECFPAGWTPTPGFFFSPGLCPNGYTTATTSSNAVGTLVDTVAYCCPSSYSWSANLQSNELITGCRSEYADTLSSRTLAMFSGTGTSLVGSTTMSGSGFVLASVVQVRFQASDAAVLSPSPSPSLSSSVHIAGSTTVTTVVSVTVTTAAGGLSKGAKAGIGVGVPIAVLLLVAIGIGVILLGRWNRNAGSREHGGNGLSEMVGPVVESRRRVKSDGWGAGVFHGWQRKSKLNSSPQGK